MKQATAQGTIPKTGKASGIPTFKAPPIGKAKGESVIAKQADKAPPPPLEDDDDPPPPPPHPEDYPEEHQVPGLTRIKTPERSQTYLGSPSKDL